MPLYPIPPLGEEKGGTCVILVFTTKKRRSHMPTPFKSMLFYLSEIAKTNNYREPFCPDQHWLAFSYHN